MRYSITKSSKECLYTQADLNEHITASLFIVDGTDLKARFIVQGPIASTKVSSAAEVLAAALRFDKNGRELSLNIDTDVDFEKLYDNLDAVVDGDLDDDDFGDDDYYDDDHYLENDIDDAMFEEYYYMDDDDEYQFLEDDNMDDQELNEIRKKRAERDGLTEEERKATKEKRKAEKMKKFEELKQKREDMRKKREEKMSKRELKKQQKKDKAKEKGAELKGLRSGEPYQKTYQVEKEGWYRYCVQAPSAVIEVEIELRKSSEVGRPNAKTGHLQTYEHQDMAQREKKLLKQMTIDGEGAVKEEDLHTTKSQISKLNRLLYEIKEKQKHERHRLSVHKAVNDHSHSRMVLSSLFETVFYIVVSAFQVYTIRKWFSGSPILGY